MPKNFPNKEITRNLAMASRAVQSPFQPRLHKAQRRKAREGRGSLPKPGARDGPLIDGSVLPSAGELRYGTGGSRKPRFTAADHNDIPHDQRAMDRDVDNSSSKPLQPHWSRAMLTKFAVAFVIVAVSATGSCLGGRQDNLAEPRLNWVRTTLAAHLLPQVSRMVDAA